MTLARAFLILICFNFVALLAVVSNKPFSTRGEPREALVAQAMLVSGNYVLAEGYGGAVPSKPPFLQWTIVGAAKLLGGLDEFSARLPSAAGAFLFSLVFFVFLVRRAEPGTALASCLLLLTSIEWFRASLACRVDMLLAVFFGLALLSLFAWEERQLKRYPWGALLCLVAATLAKGPVGVVLPLAIFGLHLLFQGYSFKRALLACISLGMPALVLAGVWYVLAFAERGEAFWAKVYYENFARFSSTMDDEPHKHSGAYLLGTLLLGFMPWTLLLLPFVWVMRERVVASLRHPIATLRSAPALVRFSTLVVLLVFGFFLIPSSKRSVYLLPAYPFLCFLSASGLEALLKVANDQLERAAKMLAALFLALLVVGISALSTQMLTGPSALAWFGSQGDVAFIAQALGIDANTPWSTMLALCVPPGIAAVVLVSLQRNQMQMVSVVALALIPLSIFVVSDNVMVSRYAEALSPKEFAMEVKRVVPAQARVTSFSNEFYGLSFYSQISIKRAEQFVPMPGEFVLAYDQDVSMLRAKFPQRTFSPMLRSAKPIVKPGRHIVLLRVG